MFDVLFRKGDHQYYRMILGNRASQLSVSYSPKCMSAGLVQRMPIKHVINYTGYFRHAVTINVQTAQATSRSIALKCIRLLIIVWFRDMHPTRLYVSFFGVTPWNSSVGFVQIPECCMLVITLLAVSKKLWTQITRVWSQIWSGVIWRRCSRKIAKTLWNVELSMFMLVLDR